MNVVTIDLDEYLDLPPRQLKAKLRALLPKPTPPSRTRERTRSLSLEDSKNLEREQEQLPRAWHEAAVAERQRAGLVEVDLHAEWRKHVLWYADRGREIRLGSWLLWALRAWLDQTNTPAKPARVGNAAISSPGCGNAAISPPGDEREQRQARDWVKRGFWLRDGSWGPAPDQPGCTLPPGLVAWCRDNRDAAC